MRQPDHAAHVGGEIGKPDFYFGAHRSAFGYALASPSRATLTVLRQTFEAAGIEFLNGDEPGVKLPRTGVAAGLSVSFDLGAFVHGKKQLAFVGMAKGRAPGRVREEGGLNAINSNEKCKKHRHPWRRDN